MDKQGKWGKKWEKSGNLENGKLLTKKMEKIGKISRKKGKNLESEKNIGKNGKQKQMGEKGKMGKNKND